MPAHRLGRVSWMSSGARQLFDPEALPVAAGPEAQTDAGGRPGVLSIGGLYEEVEGALGQAFPRNRHLWVRGEIAHLSDHRSGHLYLSLVDPEEEGGAAGSRSRGGVPTLNVKCWRSSWAPLRHGLAKQGIELAEGMVVVLRGTLDLYRAKGEISLILVEVDVTALLGRIAAQRAQLLRRLEEEGLLRRNASLPLPAVALRVGLIASPGTEGYNDFLGQLTGSGLGFHISVVKVAVQGAGAPASVARAVRALSRSDCDVIAMVRGGERGPTWPRSRPRSWRGPSPAHPSRCSPGLATRATRRWRTSSPLGPASRPRSAGTRSWWPPGPGGATTWHSLPTCWPAGCPASSARPKRGMPKRAVTSQRRPGTTCDGTAIAWARRRPHWGAPHLHGSNPARLLFAPMPPGWGPWPSAISGAWTSA